MRLNQHPRWQAAWRAMRRNAWWPAGLLAAALLAWTQPRAVQRLDLLAYDLLAPANASAASPPVLIAIDEASLAALGRWPWPRARHAELVDRLREAGAAAIGIDLLFTEPDAARPEDDAALAAALARHGRVVLPVAPTAQAGGTLAELLPVAALQQASRLGHVDVEVDADGQTRRLFLQGGVGQPRHPAFALALAQAAQAWPAGSSLPGARRDAAALARPGAWARDHEVLLPRMRPLPQVSYAAALQTPGALEGVQGRTVLVGITAAGLGGELASSLAARRAPLPAVEFHGQAYAALLGAKLVEPIAATVSTVIALLLVSSLVLWPARGTKGSVVAAAALLAAPVVLSLAVLLALRVWLPPATATLALAVAYGCWAANQLGLVNRQLRRARQHAQAALHAIGDGVLTVDALGMVRYANPVALKQSDGHAQAGVRFSEALPLHPESRDTLNAALQMCLAGGEPLRLPGHLSLLPTADGTTHYLRAALSPLCGPRGEVDGAVVVLADVTDAVAATLRLDHAATHDALTGLPNRVLLQDRLGLAIARAQRLQRSVAVLFLDLNRFKRINDSLGHRQGDQVLRNVAERLRTVCRASDVVARWGGDEFVVLMEDLAGEEAVAAAAAKLVATLSEDIEIGGLRLSSGCSVGIAMAPRDGTDIDGLLARADMAMYRAKGLPNAGYQFYSADLNVWTRERLTLEADLRDSLGEGRFELHYQPQYALADGSLVGFEALLRWQRAPGQLLAPGRFMAVAEESGLIVDIGAWVVRQATQDIAAWLAAGLRPVPVAVNVSARQCVNRHIVDVVREALQRTGIPPSLLKLEITETTAMTDAEHVIALLEEINALGVRLAVDDFGTGYSSLSYLKRYPIGELKIDRSFVRDLATDEDDAAIVRATIALAHGLGIQVVAEGVENEQQSDFLALQQCDFAQGYLFSKPLPLPQATRLL